MRALSKAGWSAVGVGTGDEGVQELQSRVSTFDVILLDQLMPGMSGIETLAKIRAFNPNLPVVIMTGFTTEESVRESKQQGAFDCLAKPFTPEQLRDAVRRAVEKHF
jgi:DNA-binding NtrC family response regulator